MNPDSLSDRSGGPMGSTAPQGRVNAAPGPAVPAEPPLPSVVEAAVAATLEADEAARQARAAMRSAQLLSATARLMEREGSQSVSMQALAEEAGVSVGLIYRYFG